MAGGSNYRFNTLGACPAFGRVRGGRVPTLPWALLGGIYLPLDFSCDGNQNYTSTPPPKLTSHGIAKLIRWLFSALLFLTINVCYRIRFGGFFLEN